MSMPGKILAVWLAGIALLNAQSLMVKTPAPNNRKVEFRYRLPKNYDADSRIMVLFGGRNWQAKDTLARYKFDGLADKHKLILLSPTFCDDDYWEPEQWSGKALFEAVVQLEKQYKLKPQKLFYYGYSAGGQCAALFYAYAPERVAAWALHASGVYFDARNWKKTLVPVQISCGMEDEERYTISRDFIFNFRESGGSVIWRPYPDKDHILTPEALQLARQFFEDQILKRGIEFIGEDDTGLIYSPAEAQKIMVEYRNPLTSAALRDLWRVER
jgi:poly(3-hydroxybutyrate) depolymerase